MKIILQNIKPFDKFWFRSCFYQAFLSVALYYGGDVNRYCANQIFRYRKMKKGHLTVEKENVVRYDRVEGIREHRRRYEKQFIKAVEEKIKHGYPVIFAADSYYVPYRNDCYLKEHSTHYILVYGFDDVRKRFYVFDHSYWGSYKYVEKEALYADFIRAYAEYSNQNPARFSFFWYTKDGKKEVRPRVPAHDLRLLESYIANFKVSLKNGGDLDDYRQFFLGETWLRVPVMEMFRSLNNVRCYQIVERFIGQAKLICAVLTKYNGRSIPEETRENLIRYADEFVRRKRNLDEAEAEYYASLPY